MVTKNDHEAAAKGELFKAGFVAVAGRPNVGKSTLINQILGQKVAAVTHKPQTTRRQQFGILTRPNAQVIFVDTPGIHRPFHKLGERMNEEAEAAFEDVDVILVIVDGSVPVHDEDHIIASLIKEITKSIPVILAINKIDLISLEALKDRRTEFRGLFPDVQDFPISATQGQNIQGLLEQIIELLPEGGMFFPENQVTDLYEREIAADLIREAALLQLRDEVPHSLAVRIDEFTERGDSGAYIAATLFVERESQKGIVIGKGGMMLRELGTAARREIESMSGRKVFLKLRVKVRKNWRNDDNILARFGFAKKGK